MVPWCVRDRGKFTIKETTFQHDLCLYQSWYTQVFLLQPAHDRWHACLQNHFKFFSATHFFHSLALKTLYGTIGLDNVYKLVPCGVNSCYIADADTCSITRVILGLHPANERRRYKVTPSVIGWAETYNQPCITSNQQNDQHSHRN